MHRKQGGGNRCHRAAVDSLFRKLPRRPELIVPNGSIGWKAAIPGRSVIAVWHPKRCSQRNARKTEQFAGWAGAVGANRPLGRLWVALRSLLPLGRVADQ
jgi:hypothetical protein